MCVLCVCVRSCTHIYIYINLFNNRSGCSFKVFYVLALLGEA